MESDCNEFISPYARDYPDREDVAESLVPWFAYRYFPGRVVESELADIGGVMPNRLAFFDSLNSLNNCDLSPILPVSHFMVLA